MHRTWTKLKNAHELEENCNCNTHHRQNISVTHNSTICRHKNLQEIREKMEKHCCFLLICRHFSAL